MSWDEFHTESERFAAEAEIALRRGARDRANELYARAAEAETRACEALDPSKTRTVGISVVSAVSLLYKAGQYERAEQLSYKWLATDRLPAFAKDQIRVLLQSVWNEEVRESAGLQFAPGEVMVSVKGGEIVAGGAPLDLIVEKVQTIQSLFYRTAELMYELPHRKRGAPSEQIQDMCRPWVFQMAPGSYQFAVAVQGPRQQELFERPRATGEQIAARFLEILRASVEEPEDALPSIVPDREYRGTFLKLARNLAPTGKTFHEMEVRSVREPRPISIVPSVRTAIVQAIRRERPPEAVLPEQQEQTLRGVLRAVHLDQDWLEVTIGDQQFRVIQVGEAVDDVIGPMVNRPVFVHTVQDPRGRFLFRDIERDE